MTQIPVTVKIDTTVKAQAQKLARSLGLSLSAIVENQLREVVRAKRVVFEEDLVPQAHVAKELKKIEADVKAGRNLSGPFGTHEDLAHHLNNLGRAD